VEERKDGKRGSIFWFSFPYRPDLSSQCHEKAGDMLRMESGSSKLIPPIMSSLSRHDFLTAARVASLEPDPQIQNLHVMLIDDSLTIIKVAGRSLRQNGYHVTTANNGSAGLDRLIEGYEKDEFHFVLMDLQMPVMDGIEAVRRYRIFETGKKMESEVDPLDVPRRRLPIIGEEGKSLLLF
jgi:CheY-like chemotaxis protein